MYVFLAWLPLYLTEVHNLSLKAMGVWASFPWIALMAMVFVAGYISDKMANGKNSERQYTMRTFTLWPASPSPLSACTSPHIRRVPK